MAYELNSKLQSLKPYQTVQGNYRIHLDANESFRLPPPELISRIEEAVSAVPFNRYPDPYAAELCRAFADYYHVSPENVVAGNGSDELISIICGTFLMKGERMMTLSPDFSMYHFYSSINETEYVEFRKNEDFTVNIDKVIAAIQEKHIRLVIFSNPCNPTSKGIVRADIRKLVKSVEALVVLDEAYMDFWDQSMLGEVDDFDNLIILRTCSKAFGMAAIRLGFAVSNQKLIRAIKAVKSPYNVNALTQTIGSIVLQQKNWVQASIHKIVASKNALSEMLKYVEEQNPEKLRVYDGVTNFVLLKVSRGEEVYDSLLQKGISVRFFREGNYLRVTAGTMEENREFVSALKESL
jgi:histidinol-phosphate aminotransferase